MAKPVVYLLLHHSGPGYHCTTKEKNKTVAFKELSGNLTLSDQIRWGSYLSVRSYSSGTVFTPTTCCVWNPFVSSSGQGQLSEGIIESTCISSSSQLFPVSQPKGDGAAGSQSSNAKTQDTGVRQFMKHLCPQNYALGLWSLEEVDPLAQELPRYCIWIQVGGSHASNTWIAIALGLYSASRILTATAQHKEYVLGNEYTKVDFIQPR